MAKKVIRLTESDLHNMVSETIKRVLNESNDRYTTHWYHGKTQRAGDGIRTGNLEQAKQWCRNQASKNNECMFIVFDTASDYYVYRCANRNSEFAGKENVELI